MQLGSMIESGDEQTMGEFIQDEKQISYVPDVSFFGDWKKDIIWGMIIGILVFLTTSFVTA